MITGKNYIGNALKGSGSKTFKTFNPQLNKETSWQFIEATEEELKEAVTLAWDAFKEFQKTTGTQKATFLRAIADEIEALDNELIETYCAESGLPEGRAKGERGRTCFQLRMFADLVEDGSWVDASIDIANKDRQPNPKPDLRKMLIPIGPIAVFGASNFPLAYSTAGGDTASALAAGCPVVVKSHPMHAGTGELVASAILKAAKNTKMPNGVFSNLNSSGIEVGKLLVNHPLIKGVGFTGSIGGGRALFNMAAEREEPIPVFAEMGSINPVIVLPKALKQKGKEWAKKYASSITLGTGQFCTNPGLILGIAGEELEDFISTLGEEIEKVEPMCMLNPGILSRYEENKKKMLAENDVSIVTDYSSNVPQNYAKQAVITADGESFLKNPQLHQEVFGPFSLVVKFQNKEQLTEAIANLEGQLTGTFISEDNEVEDYGDVVHALQNRVGRVIFNGVPTGVEVCTAMQHGGPYPASTDSRFGAVGVQGIQRWVRPLSFQDWPNHLLPDALKNDNPLQILRTVNGDKTKDAI
ncbi:2,5-dioxovalerate dehydrogenase [Croceivirga lutea]|uniref:aldehyde dehydrogenase (NADP(+)) n=1 Tax=Croceivirga lutea TaxID=1775167 RepID=UPI00163B2CB2|nr:aldehyde dehydrogenase (NADP(+)) [Croceivirga lutea]GGG43646.1 2,5-dioxovalerate dehydrogenase [Croceivirga lutea]